MLWAQHPSALLCVLAHPACSALLPLLLLLLLLVLPRHTQVGVMHCVHRLIARVHAASATQASGPCRPAMVQFMRSDLCEVPTVMSCWKPLTAMPYLKKSLKSGTGSHAITLYNSKARYGRIKH
jgi:hypothetical protein